jgi:hypothetical protein
LEAERFFALRFGEQPVFKDQPHCALAGGEGFLSDCCGRRCIARVRVELGDQAD